MIKIAIPLFLFALSAYSADFDRAIVADSETNFKVDVLLKDSSLEDAEVMVRSTADFLQVYVPKITLTNGPQLYPIKGGQFKSVLVAPSPDPKGVRIKLTLNKNHRGTIDPEKIAMSLGSDGISLSIAKASLADRLRSAESVRHLLVRRDVEKKTSVEPIRLVAELPKKDLPSDLSKDSAAVEKTKVAEPLPSAAATAKSEADILVKSVDAKNEGNSEGNLSRLIFSLAAVGLILAIGMVFLAKYTKKRSLLSQAPKMRVLQQFHLGPKKQLMVVQIAGESMLLGVTDQNITFLKNLSLLDEEIPNQVPTSFSTALSESARSDQDEFAMQGLGEIRDRVSRQIASMRSYS